MLIRRRSESWLRMEVEGFGVVRTLGFARANYKDW